MLALKLWALRAPPRLRSPLSGKSRLKLMPLPTPRPSVFERPKSALGMLEANAGVEKAMVAARAASVKKVRFICPPFAPRA
ncbi:hypothetical protein D3C72_2258690 [compost metagenome]